MGYGVMAYRIDTDKISGLFGSGKQVPTENFTRRIEAMDENFEADYGWTSTEALLQEYLGGNDNFLTYEWSTAKHWYTLEMLVSEYGKMLVNGAWYPGGNIDPFYKSDVFKINVFDRSGKLKLKGAEDFPAVFTIFRDGLDEAEKHAGDIEDEDQRKEFLQWIETAREHQEDLMLFYY